MALCQGCKRFVKSAVPRCRGTVMCAMVSGSFRKGCLEMKIAILENDPHGVQLLKQWLQSAGHTSRVFVSGSMFMRDLNRDTYDLVIIGSTAPDMDGTQITVALREQLDAPISIIRLAGKADESEIVAALKAGADDCIVKPVRQFELLARIEALARRAQRLDERAERLEFGALCIDLKNRMIMRDGARVTLTPKTYNLAVFLLTNSGQLLSRAYLLERIWGSNKSAATRTLDTHISRLRTVLGLTPDKGWQLQSVYQHGYRLDRTEGASSSRATATSAMNAEFCTP